MIGSADELGRVVVPLGPPLVPAPAERPHNFAVNNGRPFPVVTASYSAPTTPPFYAVDGNLWYDASPPNRWTTAGSPNAEDWFAVDFGVGRPVRSVNLSFIEEGDSIAPPVEYAIDVWRNGEWDPVPATRSPRVPGGGRSNHAILGSRVGPTSRLRVRFTHREGMATGLSEIEAWGDAPLPLPAPVSPSANLATGARVTASYTFEGDRLEHLNDMQIGFTRYSRNRWSARGSANASDTVTIELDGVHAIGAIDLYLYGDRGLEAPAAYAIETWNGGEWEVARETGRVPSIPTSWAMNRVRLAPAETDRVRIVFDHALPAFTGVTEIMIWETQE